MWEYVGGAGGQLMSHSQQFYVILINVVKKNDSLPLAWGFSHHQSFFIAFLFCFFNIKANFILVLCHPSIPTLEKKAIFSLKSTESLSSICALKKEGGKGKDICKIIFYGNYFFHSTKMLLFVHDAVPHVTARRLRGKQKRK